MFWIWFAIVVSIMSAMIVYVRAPFEKFFRAFVTLFLGLLGSGIFLVAIFCLVLSPIMGSKNLPIKEWQFEIVAAADGSLTEGRFFLFSGSIEEEPQYFFYSQSSNGAIRQGHIPVRRTSIFEDTEDEGYIKVWHYQPRCTFWYCQVPMDGGRNYEVHVPSGSVVRQFNFDLEK